MHETIREHMEVIGADGVHIGTVEKVEGNRIKLTKRDSGGAGFGGGHEHHHHYIPMGLVAAVHDKVRLSANGDVAVILEEEAAGMDIAENNKTGGGEAPSDSPSPSRDATLANDR